MLYTIRTACQTNPKYTPLQIFTVYMYKKKHSPPHTHTQGHETCNNMLSRSHPEESPKAKLGESLHFAGKATVFFFFFVFLPNKPCFVKQDGRVKRDEIRVKGTKKTSSDACQNWQVVRESTYKVLGRAEKCVTLSQITEADTNGCVDGNTLKCYRTNIYNIHVWRKGQSQYDQLFTRWSLVRTKLPKGGGACYLCLKQKVQMFT